MTTEMGTKRELMLAHADAWAADKTPQRERELCLAAWEYSQARERLASGATAAANAPAEVVLVPFGKDKGKPITAVNKGNLEWLMGAVETSIANPEKARFIEANQRLLDALKTEHSRRK